MGRAGEDVGGVIQAFITLLCGITSLVCILRQQRFIQLQYEQIQRQGRLLHEQEELLALRDEQLQVYENLHAEQAKQIKLLKEYVSLLKKASHE